MCAQLKAGGARLGCAVGQRLQLEAEAGGVDTSCGEAAAKVGQLHAHASAPCSTRGQPLVAASVPLHMTPLQFRKAALCTGSCYCPQFRSLAA